MADDFILVASGDACGACLALQGTNATPPIHPNCLCQVVPREKDCEVHEMELSVGEAGVVTGEIEVTCPDGSTIGQSVSINTGRHPVGYDEQIDVIEAVELSLEEELCAQCSDEPDDFLCC